MHKPLTARFVESLKPSSRQLEIWDASEKGFGVRVSPGGKKSYFAIYRVRGRQRYAPLGDVEDITLADAREKAREVRRKAKGGIDAKQEKKSDVDALSFSALCDAALAHWKSESKRSWEDDEDRMNTYLKPRWGDRKPWEIRRDDIQELLDEISACGKSGKPARRQAACVRSLISTIFTYALSRKSFNRRLEANPCSALGKAYGGKRRERMLSDSEFRQAWAMADASPLKTRALLKLRALTLQRGITIARMRVEQIKGQWWTIPGEAMKNKRAHRIWLVKDAKKLVDELMGEQRDGWMFPSNISNPKRKPHWDPEKPVQEIMQRLHAESKDIRRTATTCITSAGICSRPELQLWVLSHSKGDVGSVYDLYDYADEKKDVLEKWAKRLATILRPADPLAKALAVEFPKARAARQAAKNARQAKAA